ncbi:MAG: hypothetical protein FJ144_07240 [Deltaproteobacteria bacterium]|nr:hypothetical protein [Deltaproteobacteria bacterium]
MTKRFFPLAAAVAAVSLLALPADGLAGPELHLDVGRIEDSVVFDIDTFHPPKGRVRLDPIAPVSGNCVLDPSEACVGGPGIRKLLRFDVLVHNRGDEDLVVGDPKTLPDLFIFSECHGHHHFAQASTYELLDETGNLVAIGRKQGFCLEDTVPSGPQTQVGRRYDCSYQGLQVGYADLYPAELDCQWIDVTDLPAGDYTLHVVFNPAHLLEDDDLTNNEAFVPVDIDEATSAAPVVSRIRRPSHDAVVTAGSPLRVAWSASDDEAIATQEIWFSADDGETWEQIVGDLPGGERSYAWTIPAGVVTGEARIQVVARDEEVQRGALVSDAFHVRGATRGRRLAVR